jgi:hypothetical protein
MWPFDYFKKKSPAFVPEVTPEEQARREASYAECDRIEKFSRDNPPGPALDKMVFDSVFSEPDPHRWTIPDFSTDPKFMMELLAHLSRTRHVRAIIRVGDASEEHMDSDVTLTAGDCNCPHIKDYDPNDGHGFTYVEGIPGRTPMHAVALAALEICKRVNPERELLDKSETRQ